MYKEELALNNQQWLICHKTQPNTKQLIQLFKLIPLIFFPNPAEGNIKE